MDKIIEVKQLNKSYKKRKTNEYIHAVQDISFYVQRGEILGLLGPNGAGKSSTIKMLCGLLIPDSGTIFVNGVDMRKNRLKGLSHISAVLEGNRNVYWRLTVRENLEYFAGNRGFSRREMKRKIDDLLLQFRLKEKEDELVNGLSRGMQQKLAIAVAMLAESEVILLDEPTLGLDVETSYEIREILREVVRKQNRTIIVSSHDMDVVQDICDRAIIINKGKIVADDKVENLMKLFQARSYSITLEGQLTEEQQNILCEKFPNIVYKQDTVKSVLEIDLLKSEDIYVLFDILKLNHIPVESIDRTIVNFEQIFMKIVKGEIKHDSMV